MLRFRIFHFLRARDAHTALALVVAVMLFASNAAQAQQTPSQQTLQVLHNHVRPVVSGGQAAQIAALPAEQTLNLSIVLPLRNQEALTSLLSRLYDPSSPDYRHFLSVEEFTDRFGPSAGDYQAVVAFAQAEGFTVNAAPANRLVVPVSGTVAQINHAFNLTMRTYQHPTENRTFYSPDREPALNLAVRVSHIAGLNNYSIPHPSIKFAVEGQALANIAGSAPGGSYLGSDMRAAYYGGTTLTGNGQAVGILEFGGYNLSDVNATFSNAGQTYTVPINNVLLNGASAGANGQDAEQVLDIVQAIGMAPGLSQVRVYIGAGQDDPNILSAMASENIAKQLSSSWSWKPDDPTVDDVFFEEFAAQGQSFFDASGDDGAYDAAISPYFYPAEDANVTAVGGTHLTTNGAGGAWVSETAWNSNGYGSGGGISPDAIAGPSWQTGAANSSNGGSAALRNVPDVAMEGDFDNYYCNLGSCGGGAAGTSFAAPRWAGFMALVNQQAVEAGNAPAGGIGFINPALYAIAAGTSYGNDLHDITVGNNDTQAQPVWFNAVPGYDLVTGLGSANGQPLIDALAGPQVPGFWLQSSVGSFSVNQGSSSSATITVTDAGGFTGSVTLAVTSSLPAGVTASWGTNPTTGSSVLTITASSSAPLSNTRVTVTGTSGNLTQTTQFALSVHAPGFTLSASPSTLGIDQSGSATSTITVNRLYGFTGNVSLAITSALPTGVTASWGTNPTSGTSILTLTASSSAPASNTTLTITGTSGSLTATTTLSVAIYAPTFVLSTSGTLNLGQGTSGAAYVYVTPEYGFAGSVNLTVSGLPAGVTASFSPNPSTGYSYLTFNVSSQAVPGVNTLTITGTSGAITASTTLTLGIYPPSFTLGDYGPVSVGQGSSATSYVYINALYGFSSNVNFSVSGLPSGVTASFVANPAIGSSLLMLTASSTAALGPATLTITGTSGSATASTTLAIAVYAPTFTVSTYTSLNVGQGSTTSASVSVTPLYGFSGTVNLSLSGLPAGVTASFSLNPATSSSTLTLTASGSAPVANATVTLTGTSGSLTASTTFTLTVAAPSFTLSASALTVNPGSSGVTAVSVNPLNGFNGIVNFAVSGLPNGVTASWSLTPYAGTYFLTLSVSGTAALGTTVLTITGTSGAFTATTTMSLGVFAPSFTLSDYSAPSLGQGSSTTSYVYVNPQSGFTGSVSLGVLGLPAGVTASFATNPTAYESGVTFTSAATAAPGQYNVTLVGSYGSQTASTPLVLTVYAPTFTLSASSLSLGQGASVTSSVYLYPQYGFSGNVHLVASGLPTGVTAGFAQNPATASTTLTLTASSTAPAGQYSVTITGTSGTVTASTTLYLTVGVPGFSINAGSVNVGQGGSVPDNVTVNSQFGFTGNVTLSVSGLPSGATGYFAFNPVAAGTSTNLALYTTSNVTPGQYTVTVTGSSGTLTASTTFLLTVSQPSYTISAYYTTSLVQGGSTTAYVYVNPQNGFLGAVNLSISGLPSGVTAYFTPNPATGASTMTLNASSTASLGQYNTTITGTYGATTASTNLVVGVYAPSFGLSAYAVNLGQGSSGTGYVYVTSTYGFTGNVNLAISGLPAGVTASFAQNPTIGGSSSITFTASSTAALGQYNVTITGTSGALSASTLLTLAVYAPSFTIYDGSSLVMSAGGSTTSYISVNPVYGFAGNVNFSIAGLPSGVTASISPNPATSSAALTLTASNTAALGRYNIVVTGTSGSITATTTVPLALLAPTFTISSDSSVVLNPGGSGTAAVFINSTYGVVGPVSLAASGLPRGVTASFSPNPSSTTSSVLTLTAANPASAGQYDVTITGTSSTASATTTTSLTVNPPAGLATASIAVNGSAQPGDASPITVSFNGFTETVKYDPTSTPNSVASAFAAMFSRDYLQLGLCASASGNAITFKLKQGLFDHPAITGSNVSFNLATAGFP